MPPNNHEEQAEKSLSKTVKARKAARIRQTKPLVGNTQWFPREVTDGEWIMAHIRARHMKKRTILRSGERPCQIVEFDRRVTEDEWLEAGRRLMSREDQLTQFQGSDSEIYELSVMEKIEQLRNRGFGYRRIAKDNILLALAAVLRALDPRFLGEEREVAEDYFVLILDPFLRKAEEIDDWYETAKDKLARRELPWSLREGPITWTMVEHAFDKRGDETPKRETKAGRHDGTYWADLIWCEYEFLGYLDSARKLLEKFTPKEFARYRKRYEQIVEEIHASRMYGELTQSPVH